MNNWREIVRIVGLLVGAGTGTAGAVMGATSTQAASHNEQSLGNVRELERHLTEQIIELQDKIHSLERLLTSKVESNKDNLRGLIDEFHKTTLSQNSSILNQLGELRLQLAILQTKIGELHI